VSGAVTPERRFRLAMTNPGAVGVVFSVHDQSDRQAPWHYTIGAGHEHVSEQWHDAGPIDAYDLVVRGPDGFVQRYAGGLDDKAVAAEARLVPGSDKEARLLLANRTGGMMQFIIRLDPAYECDGERERRIAVPAGQTVTHVWSLQKSGGWHDFSIQLAGEQLFERRFAGRIAGLRDPLTDPAIGSMRVTA
jgi:phospholipase C